MIYRHEIDGLRALAVIAVVGNHFFPEFVPNGGLGVDLFFAISGFVIAGTLVDRLGHPAGDFFFHFYARRIKRLLPALAAMIGVTSILISILDPFPEQSLNTGLAALFGFANIQLYLVEMDYFGMLADLNPFTHTWSLGVEEQFYFLFPFLLWAGYRYLGATVTWLAFGGLTLASLLAWFWISRGDPVLAFYIVVFRFWQIGAGALVFFLQQRLDRQWPYEYALKWAALAALTLLVIGPFEFERTRLAAMLCTVGTCVLLFLIRPTARPVAILQSGVARYFGNTSYSLYLWHWPVLVLLRWGVGLTTAGAIAGIGVSILLAHISYTWVEKPLRRANWSTSLRREVGIGLGVMVLAAGVLHLYNTQGRLVFAPPVQAATESLGRPSLFLPYESENGTIWAGGDCTLLDDTEVGKTIQPQRCTVGETLEAARFRVLVIGNSFAPSFAAAYDGHRFADGTRPAFVLTAKFGGTPVPGIEWYDRSMAASNDYWQRVIPETLDMLKPGDHLLIVSDLAEFSPPERSPHQDRRIEEFRDGLVTLSRQLASREIGLSVLGPMPFLREAHCTPGMAIRQRNSDSLVFCKYYDRAETLERLQPIYDMLHETEAAGHIRVVDVLPVFCPAETCEYTDEDGVLLYRDVFSHASLEASIKARPIFRAWLESIDPKR